MSSGPAARTPPLVITATPIVRRFSWLPVLLFGPAVVWTFVFFLVPLGVMIWRSLQRDGFSLFYYQKLFATPLYLGALVTTFEISAVVTLGCLALGYPVAYFVTTAGPRLRAAVLLLVVIPS